MQFSFYKLSIYINQNHFYGFIFNSNPLKIQGKSITQSPIQQLKTT